METTEQKINLQLNIDGYKFFETTQSFDDEQIYFIEHGTENPCHTFRVDDVIFYIIIK